MLLNINKMFKPNIYIPMRLDEKLNKMDITPLKFCLEGECKKKKGGDTMYAVKIFRGLTSDSLEKQINEFLNKHHAEIKEEPRINLFDTAKYFIACLLFKTE